RGGRSAGGSLLEVAPEIRLDVDDHLSAVGRGLMHEQDEVRIVGVHGGRIIKVVEIPVALVGPARGRRLQELVVAEDREIAVGGAVRHVVAGELSSRAVSGLPSRAGIHAAAEVLVAISPGYATRGHPADLRRLAGAPEGESTG